MAYEQVGNIQTDYVFSQRIARTEGVLATKSLVLKLYTMSKEGEPIGKTMAHEARGFLEEEIGRGRIRPHIGMGFAILSEDMLNVSEWDEQIPHVLKSQLYGFEKGSMRRAKPLDIRENGPFCAFELGIVAYERVAWRQYLASGHTNKDKKNYLTRVASGVV